MNSKLQVLASLRVRNDMLCAKLVRDIIMSANINRFAKAEAIYKLASGGKKSALFVVYKALKK